MKSSLTYLQSNYSQFAFLEMQYYFSEQLNNIPSKRLFSVKKKKKISVLHYYSFCISYGAEITEVLQ